MAGWRLSTFLMREERIVMMIFSLFVVGFVFGSDTKGDTPLCVFVPTVDDQYRLKVLLAKIEVCFW